MVFRVQTWGTKEKKETKTKNTKPVSHAEDKKSNRVQKLVWSKTTQNKQKPKPKQNKTSPVTIITSVPWERERDITENSPWCLVKLEREHWNV